MKVSNALNTLVSGEKPGFQALSKGLIVLLCAEVVWQGVPDHEPCTANARRPTVDSRCRGTTISDTYRTDALESRPRDKIT